MDVRPPTELIDPGTGLALADYTSLPQSCHTEFQKLFESDFGLGRVYFFAECFKYNKKLVEQRRVLVLARGEFFVMLPRAEVLRCTSLGKITDVYCLKSVIAFKIPSEYDLMFRITANNKLGAISAAEYLLHAISVLHPHTNIHRDVQWLNAKHSVAARETVKEALLLNRPDNWRPGTSCQVDRVPWGKVVLLPGFEEVWRKLHPSRSKKVWEIREAAIAEQEAELRAAAIARGDDSADPSPVGTDATMSPANSSPRRRGSRRGSLHYPAEGFEAGTTTFTPGPPSSRGRRASTGPTMYYETVSPQMVNTAVGGGIGLFDKLASEAPMISNARPGEAAQRFAEKYNPENRKLSRDTQTQEHRPAGIIVDVAQPPLPKNPPPPLPPHERHSNLNRVMESSGVRRGAPVVSEHHSPQFQPMSSKTVKHGDSGHHRGPGDEDGLEPLDPGLIEMSAAASPVPYEAQVLQQAIRVMHDREQEMLIDTPRMRYEDAASPPPISVQMQNHPDAVIERAAEGKGTAGVRPENFVSPVLITNPATAIWNRAQLPPDTDKDGNKSALPDMTAPEIDSAALDLARQYSDATYRPGGGGPAARKAISEMLRSAAALIHIDSAVQDYDSKLQRVAKVTPTPKGHSRGPVSVQTLAAYSDPCFDESTILDDRTFSEVDSTPRKAQPSAYLSSLLDEQERQRLGLDVVCKKLDGLIQSPGGRVLEPPPSREHVHTASPSGRWDGEEVHSAGSPLHESVPMGSALLPIPDEARLSKYQRALRSSLRPVNHSPPVLKRKPRTTRESQANTSEIPRRLLTAAGEERL